MHREGFSLMS